MKKARLSYHRSRSNEVRLWLSLIAYHLGNPWRRLALPKRFDQWLLGSLQQRLDPTRCTISGAVVSVLVPVGFSEGCLTMRNDARCVLAIR